MLSDANASELFEWDSKENCEQYKWDDGNIQQHNDIGRYIDSEQWVLCE